MQFETMMGLGVAGNFAGHLEQAGEAKDFQAVKVKDARQPKAIFPFYVPAAGAGFLSVFPLSAQRIQAPVGADNLQIEPEIGLVCDIGYEGGRVVSLTPRWFGAYNDCSIRKPNARKISEKKNWGPASKGCSATLLPVDHFSTGGVLDHYRIASFLLRDGQVHAYGIDSPAVEYSYFHQTLLDWIVERMNHQTDEGPAEHIAALLGQAGYPAQALISIGATRYTAYGECHFLQPGDTSVVLVYDGRRYAPEQIHQRVEAGSFDGEGISALVQQVG